MKNYPYPDKPLKTDKEIKDHYETLIFNCLNWLKLDGYRFYVLLPGDDNFTRHDNAGASICVEYPYKKFSVSIQQDSVDKAKKEKPTAPFWENIESSMFHEIMHIITWRGVELAKKRYVTPVDIDENDEFTVDHLTNTFYSVIRETRELRSKKK
jgi:hypothetical protein